MSIEKIKEHNNDIDAKLGFLVKNNRFIERSLRSIYTDAKSLSKIIGPARLETVKRAYLQQAVNTRIAQRVHFKFKITRMF